LQCGKRLLLTLRHGSQEARRVFVTDLLDLLEDSPARTDVRIARFHHYVKGVTLAMVAAEKSDNVAQSVPEADILGIEPDLSEPASVPIHHQIIVVGQN
jgi:hypothetical protein